jgi:hypothetical protein
MSPLLLLLFAVVILLAAIGWWYWRHQRPSSDVIVAEKASAVEPNTVSIPDGEDEDRQRIRRTGQTQKLDRKIEHGPYRPIEDRGEPSRVQMRTRP